MDGQQELHQNYAPISQSRHDFITDYSATPASWSGLSARHSDLFEASMFAINLTSIALQKLKPFARLHYISMKMASTHCTPNFLLIYQRVTVVHSVSSLERADSYKAGKESRMGLSYSKVPQVQLIFTKYPNSRILNLISTGFHI